MLWTGRKREEINGFPPYLYCRGSRAGASPSRRSGCVRRYTAGQIGNWIRFCRRRKIAACMRRWGIGTQVKRRWSMRDLPWCFMRKSGNSDGYAKLYKAGRGRGDDSGLGGLSPPCLGQPGFGTLNGGTDLKDGISSIQLIAGGRRQSWSPRQSGTGNSSPGTDILPGLFLRCPGQDDPFSLWRHGNESD